MCISLNLSAQGKSATIGGGGTAPILTAGLVMLGSRQNLNNHPQTKVLKEFLSARMCLPRPQKENSKNQTQSNSHQMDRRPCGRNQQLERDQKTEGVNESQTVLGYIPSMIFPFFKGLKGIQKETPATGVSKNQKHN